MAKKKQYSMALQNPAFGVRGCLSNFAISAGRSGGLGWLDNHGWGSGCRCRAQGFGKGGGSVSSLGSASVRDDFDACVQARPDETARPYILNAGMLSRPAHIYGSEPTVLSATAWQRKV